MLRLNPGMVCVFGLLVLGSSQALAQNASIATSLGLFVFPGEDQSAEVQSADEAACYAWAQNATGTNPIQIEEEAAEPVAAPQQSVASGAGRGILRGAARGALIADIADENTSHGAWAGAVVGSARGAQRQQVRNDVSRSMATAEQQADADQARAEFNKAMTACLEGKGYTVR